MKNITIALPDIYVDRLHDLKEIGKIPSRSEAIRKALRAFLTKEFKTYNLLKNKQN